MHEVDRLVGARVRAFRLEQKMSQAALASRLGLTSQQLQKYESGANRISASKIYQIARLLGVSIGSLFADATIASEMAIAATVGANVLPQELIETDFLIAKDLSKLPETPVKQHLRALISALAV